jgi:hypothetical protein
VSVCPSVFVSVFPYVFVSVYPSVSVIASASPSSTVLKLPIKILTYNNNKKEKKIKQKTKKIYKKGPEKGAIKKEAKEKLLSTYRLCYLSLKDSS